MEALLYFVLWAALIFVMMRLGCGVRAAGHGRAAAAERGAAGPDGALRWVAPSRAPDPVCGKVVVTDRAKPSVFAGEVYYFCSRECREVFEAAPDIYLGVETPAENRLLEHSHV